MKELEKTKKVVEGLRAHSSCRCAGCPYLGIEDCQSVLYNDAIEVIHAQKFLLNRRAKQKTDAGSGYIILHTIEGNRTVVVRADHILYALDEEKYNRCIVRIMSGSDEETIALLVKESAIDIFEKLGGDVEG